MSLDAFIEMIKESNDLGLSIFDEKHNRLRLFAEGEPIPKREMRLYRDEDDTIPKLEVYVQKWDLGYHVIVNSYPYDPKYHRNTGAPIEDAQVVDQIRSYLTDVIPSPRPNQNEPVV